MTSDIHDLMKGLAEQRPVFHSEADFQHALAWQIHKRPPKNEPRLEYPFQVETPADGKKPMYLDIWLPDRKIAIELKYRTRKLETSYKDEAFRLKAQGAQDIARYDFLKDIQRLERATKSEYWAGITGYAVLLTSEHLYLNPPRSGATVDASFHICEGRELTGTLNWNNASDGTMKTRKCAINLEGSYMMKWHHYSNIGETYGKFRYLAVKVSVG